MKGKKVTVGVTGGIAAYKAAELVRLLVREGGQVSVAMTRNATRFITPITFQALTGSPVIWDMFAQEGPDMEHISWAQQSDMIVVAPATANIIGKMACGIADDFLSTMLLASTAPILLCPAMNVKMYENPVVQENLTRLKERGIHIMEPQEGVLACKAEGKGRLPEPGAIFERIKGIIAPKDLEDYKLLVTAGPTVEPIDPVRFISNHSSGRMGYALARAARDRGAHVVLVSGPTSLTPPYGVEFHRVETAQEMKEVVVDTAPQCDAVIKAAAVSDYRPKAQASQKLKKGAKTLKLELVKNPDILAELGKMKDKAPGRPILVGFAAETQDLLANARKKLEAKNLDMIVANDVSRSDAGFQVETNQVKLIFRNGGIKELPLMSKEKVAHKILDHVKDMLGA